MSQSADDPRTRDPLPSSAYEPRDTGWPSGTVFGRWNPIPMGMYADLIIRMMGATTKDIEAHLRNVIGKEVSKDQPFVFIPNENAPGQSGGYFYDKQTGQIHTEEQMGQKSPIYVQLAKGEITEDQAKEQISGVKDIGGNVWSPTGDNTVDDKTGGSDQDGDNDQQDEDEDGTTTAPTPSGTTNKFPNVSSNTAVRSGGKIWVQRPDTKVWEIWVDPTLPEWIKKAIDEDSNVDETIDILSSSTEDLDGDGIPDFLDPVDDTPEDDDDGAKEPIENPWPDKKPPSNEPDTSNQITWLEELPPIGKQIVRAMIDMGSDPDSISKENILVSYFFDGRPNQRRISQFFSNYSKWRSTQAQEKWNKGDADDDGILNEFDNNDFLLSSFVGGGSKPEKDTDRDGIPDWYDPYPDDRTRGLEEIGKFGFEWTTKDGRKIIIPIFGGGGNEGLNVKWEDGQTRVTIGIMEEGVLVEHEIGSIEEVADKINNAVNEGKTTIDEIQETTLDVLKNIFGPKEEDDDTTVTTSGGDDDDDGEVVDPKPVYVGPVDNDGDGVYSDVDYDDDNPNVQTKAHTIFGKSDDTGKENKVSVNDAKSDETRAKFTNLNRSAETDNEGRTDATSFTSNNNDDDYDDPEKTTVSIASGAGGGGGLFQGTTAEALGRFMPKEIVQPVPFARRAASYQRPRYSLFSEYI